MHDRWYIFKDGKATGPFSPAEIREQLREGQIDPFDLVAREGSTVRRELVEVDELFSTSKVIYEGTPEAFHTSVSVAAGGANGGQGDGRTVPGLRAASGDAGFLPGGFIPDLSQTPDGFAENDRQPDNGKAFAASDSGPRAPFMALADADAVSTSGNKALPRQSQKNKGKPKLRKDPKLFNLIDAKGRVLGPVSASEIQTAFHRGVLAQSVKVVKRGSSAQVPVQRFIAIYLQSGGAAALARPRPGLQIVPSSPAGRGGVGARFASSDPHRKITIIIVAAAILLLAAAGLIWHLSSPGKNPPRGQLRPRANVTAQKNSGTLPRPGDFKEPISAPPPKYAGPKDTAKAPKVADKKPFDTLQAVRDAERRRKFEENRKRQRARQAAENAKRKAADRASKKTMATTAKQQSANAFVPPKGAAPTVVVKAPQPPKTAPPKAATPKVAAKAQPKTAPSKPAGPTVGTLTDGQVVNGLGPMSYSKKAVEACQGPCNVSFSGAGGTVTGRFFKGGFGGVLLSKQGGVYLSGIVRKGGGVTILINGVQ